MRLRFARSETWQDRLGKHTVVEIYNGRSKIGNITGETGTAIPMQSYSTDIYGLERRSWYTLKEAKQEIREWFGVGGKEPVGSMGANQRDPDGVPGLGD